MTMAVPVVNPGGQEAPKMYRRKTLVGDHPIADAVTMLEVYEPLDIIGQGSFGIIRKVKRKSDGSVLARKELNYRKMDERDLRQLNEEVQILQSMPPNEYIVQYHERFLDQKLSMLHIVMEFCDGGDLTHVIQRCRDERLLLSEDLIWSYLTQIAMALADCHSDVDSSGKRKAVVLHRDIKPENVFLTKDNVVKLGDFGLSKAMAHAYFTNTYVGTPYYMSPELINGHQYDVKSDIWALGCLIFELCAWQPPFAQAQTQPELTKLIRDGKIPALPTGYSTALTQVVRSMLRQDPKQRPTAKQILGHDQVKYQIRGIKLRRIHDALMVEREQLQARSTAVTAQEEALTARENQLKEREAAVAMREQHVATERSQLEDEKVKLVAALGGSAQSTRAPSMLSASTGSSLLSEELDEFDIENRVPTSQSSTGSTGSSGNSEQGEVIRRVASRPSLVPRRGPMDDRYRSVASMTNRMSNTSLMSIDDTPGKASPGPSSRGPTPMSIDSSRKRLTTSRSMLNLQSNSKPNSARQLFPHQSKDCLRSAAKSQESLPPPSPSRRVPIAEESFFGQRQGSPPKRTAQAAFASPQEIPASPSRKDINNRPTPPSRTSTAPPILPTMPQTPRWNMEDEDNLPSPFLKKKPAASKDASQAQRPARAPPVVPPRTLRPSTSRLSLATKLAMGRGAAARQAAADEQQSRSAERRTSTQC